MRYKLRTANVLMSAALLLATGFIMRLSFTHRLALYINPRYIWFAGVMAGVAALLTAGYALRFGYHGSGHTRATWGRLLKLIPVCAALGVVLLAPQRSLSATAATQRGLSPAVAGPATAPITRSSYSQFSASADTLSFNDWSVVFSSVQDAKTFLGQQANLSGFVAPDPQNDVNVFYLSRFFITCCAVDATPIGVKVASPQWRSNYKEGQWLQVAATVRAQNGEYILQATNIRPIPQPGDPYAN